MVVAVIYQDVINGVIVSQELADEIVEDHSHIILRDFTTCGLVSVFYNMWPC